MSTARVIREIEVGIDLPHNLPPIKYADGRSRDMTYQPKRIWLRARFVDGVGWSLGRGSEVHVSGPIIHRKGHETVFHHGEYFGSIHRPLLPWMKKRLLQEDIPLEIMFAVNQLPYLMESEPRT